MQLCVCNSVYRQVTIPDQWKRSFYNKNHEKKWNQMSDARYNQSFQEDYNNRKGNEPVGVSNAGNNLWAKSAAKWSNWSS